MSTLTRAINNNELIQSHAFTLWCDNNMTRNSVDENIEHNLSLPSHFDRLCLKGFEDHVVNQRYHKWLVLEVNVELFKSATQVAPNLGCQYH